MKRRKLFPIVLLTMIMLLSFGLPLVPVLAVRGSYAGVNGNIVFHMTYPGNETSKQVFVMNPDGTDLKQLTPSAPPNATMRPISDEATWSPDGSKIAFSYETLANNVYVMNADGSNWHQLTEYGAGVMDTGDAAWSPDGSKMAFTTQGNQLHTISAVDAGQWVPPPPLANGRSPHWSPDGTKIVFYNFTNGLPTIYVMNPDGSDQRRLLSGGSDPCWSPDGSKIVFSSGAGIWAMSATDGAVLTNLTTSATDVQPNWSPDGTKIVFARFFPPEGSEDYGPGSIWVMNADGSNLTELTPWGRNIVNCGPRDPDWQRLTPAAPSFEIGLAFPVIGIGAGVAAATAGLAVAASRWAKPEVFTYAGYYYCRKHRVLVWPVKGGYWCPVESRLLRA